MARVVGVIIPDDKRIEYALTYIYGIGWSRAKQILENLNIDKNKKVKELSELELRKISDTIEKNYKVEGLLKEEVLSHIKRLKEIGSYRGLRHIRGLPARGQRTRSNARTKRGKRRTVGALKKQDRIKMEKQSKQ